MTEHLHSSAAQIKQILHRHPLSGADLLMDFAQRYAADAQWEDEVILLKMDLSMTTDDAEQAAIVKELENIIDQVVQHYSPEVTNNISAKEQQIAERAKSKAVDSKTVLEAKNLKKYYRSTGFTMELGHLELRLGEITGLVGENATGKTTLFRILAGDLARDSGELHYPIFHRGKRLNWVKLKQQIAYVPQEVPKWNGALLDNLKYEAATHGIKGTANQKAVNYIVQRLGLAPYLDNSWQQLSGGFKLRFVLAKALVRKPKLLILDEPLANLDIKAQITVLTDLQNLAKSLRDPMAIIISSQHLHEIEAVADQMLFMHGGTAEHLGSIADYGNDRSHNTFELTCRLSYNELVKTLTNFPYKKIWSNGMTYFVTTALDVSGYELLQYLAERSVTVHYYRDISQSVKTRFYEAYL